MDYEFNNLVNIIGEIPFKMNALKLTNFVDFMKIIPIHKSFIIHEDKSFTYLLLNH
jgi:hypothetical protein